MVKGAVKRYNRLSSIGLEISILYDCTPIGYVKLTSSSYFSVTDTAAAAKSTYARKNIEGYCVKLNTQAFRFHFPFDQPLINKFSISLKFTTMMR